MIELGISTFGETTEIEGTGITPCQGVHQYTKSIVKLGS